MAKAAPMRWETIDEALLKDIYDSDQDMYPAPELSYSRLKSWVDACPELCLCLRSDHTILGAHAADRTLHGTILVFPLRQAFWNKLRQTNISEHDVDAASMFPPRVISSGGGGGGEKVKVGLHVFHIERSPSFVVMWQDARFPVLALEEIRSRVQMCFEHWDVMGYSALTATKQGSAAFKRLGFTPSAPVTRTSLLSDQAEMMERRGDAKFTAAVSSASPGCHSREMKRVT